MSIFKFRSLTLLACCLLFACTTQGDAPAEDVAEDILTEKLDTQLVSLYRQQTESETEVQIDATASGSGDELAADLKALGARNVSAYGRVASATVRVGLLYEISRLDSLQFCRLSQAATN